MIVPTNRLLIWTGAAVPFAAFGAANPEQYMAALIPVILFIAVVLSDAFISLNKLDGVHIELPELTRLSKDREGELNLRIINEKAKVKKLNIGLSFPKEISSEIPDLKIDLPGDSETSAASWPVQASRRGRYYIEACHLETSSRLGFWGIRTSKPSKCELRVYPNIFPERKNLAAMFLGRSTHGIHAQRQVGKGRDFEKLREYTPGDSYEDIHWKATAKRGYPVTKIFQIERTQEVYVIIDSSRLSARDDRVVMERRFASRSKDGYYTSILERYVTAALIMGLAAERQGDLFGLVTFSDRVERFIRAKNGKAHYDSCREALYTLQPQSVTPDFDELFTFMASRLRRRALLVFLTNMDDPVLAESFSRNIHILSRKHLVLVNMIKPPSASPLFTNSNVQSIDDIYKELGGHFLWSNLLETRRTLKQKNVTFNTLENETMCLDIVSQYLGIKQRQIL